MPSGVPLLCRLGLGLALCLLVVSQVWANQGDTQTISRYRQALLVDPENPNLHYALGVALLQEGHTSDAIVALSQAYPAYTDSIEMHYNMGLAFSRINDPDSALLYLDQAEALGALTPPALYPLIDAFYNVALLYLEKDALTEAKSLLVKILALDPQRIEIYRILGDIAAQSGHEDEAIERFSTYLKHYPDDQSSRENLYALHFDRAQKARDKGDIQTARQEATLALTLVPDSPPVMYFLGALDYQRGALNDAVPQLAKAFPELSGEMHDSARAMLYNSARQALSLQTTDQALAAIAPLLATGDPRSKDLLLSGDIHLRRREFLKARSDYRRVLMLEPGHPQANINLTTAENGAVDLLFEHGMTQFKNTEFTDALATFTAILAIRPQDPRALTFQQKTEEKVAALATEAFDIGAKALAHNDLTGAMDAVRRGLDLAPDSEHGIALQQQILGQLGDRLATLLASGNDLLKQDDFDAAESKFKQVQALDPQNSAARDGQELTAKRRLLAADAAIEAGNQALDDGRLTDARLDFQRATALIPDLAAAQTGLLRINDLVTSMVAQEIQWGRAARASGQLDQARSHFQKALNLQDSPEAKRELAAIDRDRSAEILSLLQGARSAREKADYKTARSLYQRAVADGGSPGIRQERAEMEAKIQQLIDRLLKKAAAKTAADAPQEAILIYRNILELTPDNPDAINGVQSNRKLIKTAIDQHLLAGEQAFASGDLEAATAAYNQALFLDPYQSAAVAAMEQISTLRQNDARPGDEQRLYLLGIELYTRGRYTEAIKSWEQVLRIAPRHEKAQMNIDKAIRKLQSIKEFRGG